MKNIPVFTASNGTASLVLREIPVSGKAYVLIRAVWTTVEALLEECVQFCRMVGAETIFASWETAELPGEHCYDLIAMSCPKAALPQPRQVLEPEPLTPENSEAYLQIYNGCFRSVSGAATYTLRDLKRLYDQDKAWLLRRDGVYAAIAEISEEGLESVAVLPQFRGLGFDLTATVTQMVPSLTVNLRVASDNDRALNLYRRMGFQETGVVSRWWKIC